MLQFEDSRIWLDSFYLKNGLDVKEVKPVLSPTKNIRIVARYSASQYRGFDLVNKVLEKISKERRDAEIHLFEINGKVRLPYRHTPHEGLVGADLLSLFRSCDIFLSGSTYEGFSYPSIDRKKR